MCGRRKQELILDRGKYDSELHQLRRFDRILRTVVQITYVRLPSHRSGAVDKKGNQLIFANDLVVQEVDKLYRKCFPEITGSRKVAAAPWHHVTRSNAVVWTGRAARQRIILVR